MFLSTDLCLTSESTGAATPSYSVFSRPTHAHFQRRSGRFSFNLHARMATPRSAVFKTRHKVHSAEMRYAPGIKKSAVPQASLGSSTLFIPVPANAGYDFSMKTNTLIVVRQPSRMQGKICLWTAGKWAFVAMLRKRKNLGCVAPVGFEGSLIRERRAPGEVFMSLVRALGEHLTRYYRV